MIAITTSSSISVKPVRGRSAAIARARGCPTDSTVRSVWNRNIVRCFIGSSLDLAIGPRSRGSARRVRTGRRPFGERCPGFDRLRRPRLDIHLLLEHRLASRPRGSPSPRTIPAARQCRRRSAIRPEAHRGLQPARARTTVSCSAFMDVPAGSASRIVRAIHPARGRAGATSRVSTPTPVPRGEGFGPGAPSLAESRRRRCG